MSEPRVLIVSNRLPVTARLDGAGVELASAGGGLATGLGPWHARSGGRWIGWPGDVSTFSEAHRAQLRRELDRRGIVPVFLSADQIDRYYRGFANRVLWPLLHDLVDRVPVHSGGWDAYRRVNEVFAQAVVAVHQPGDLVWVHDYQLMLVPALVRSRLPDARIGFFLHTPFPSEDVFRILPWRRELRRGLLGADLVGFHTSAYLRHFVASLEEGDGVRHERGQVSVDGRTVRLGVYPMGIDAGAFASEAQDPGVMAEAAALRRDAAGRRLVLGVDRLDYTKGIPRRLAAVQRLFDLDPGLRDSVRYIQVAVPSRGDVDAYQAFRRQVEEMVGRINGRCATLRSTPIHYVYRSLSLPQLVALYRAAAIMLVTPLRDGMNLVAKEFVASRVDEDGVLVLSEFAGAAAELDEAVIVNPYDVEGVATALRGALTMPAAQRRERMRRLRRRVLAHDVHDWARRFMTDLRRDHEFDTRARTNGTAPALAVVSDGWAVEGPAPAAVAGRR